MKPPAALASAAAVLGVVAGAVVAQEPPPQCAANDDARCVDSSSAHTTRTPASNAQPPHTEECGLYLAPSALPRAGFGLFAGRDVPPAASVHARLGLATTSASASVSDDTSDTSSSDDNHKSDNGGLDPVLPLVDRYKSRPYRGQNRLPSYLAYMWPAHKGALSELAAAPQYPAIPHELWDFDEGYDRADGLAVYAEDIDGGRWEMLGGALEEVLWEASTIAGKAADEDDEDFGRIHALVPGLASLLNDHDELANVDRIYDYDDDEGGRGIEFAAIRPVTAGMELLMDYGEEWNSRNDAKLEFLEQRQRKKEAQISPSALQNKGHVAGLDGKWEKLDRREHYNCIEELPTEKAKRERESIGFAADSSSTVDGKRPFSEYRENTLHPWDHDGALEEEDDSVWEGYPASPSDITRPLPWLEEHGVCLSSGKLRAGPSTLPNAGGGVHAAAPLQEGETLLPSPLLAMRREDFVVYQSHPNEEHVRKILDKSTILGMELVYNYAFGHPDSPLYLVPTAPLANLFNHGGKEANVRVRWAKAGTNAAKLFEWAYNQKKGSHFATEFDAAAPFDKPNPWLKDHPIDVLERSGKLGLEYVALKDIAEGEELLLDYGDAWATAWEEHLQKEESDSAAAAFRHPLGVPGGFFPDNWLHVGDRYEVAEIKGCGEGSPECTPLEPGVAVPLTWAHNGKPIGSKYAYAVGMPKGFSDRFLEYSEKIGMIELYRKLLTEQEGYKIASDGFKVYHPGKLVNGTSSEETDEAVLANQFFAHRYATATWNLKFNMHFVAAWNEFARRSVFTALGDAGFDHALRGIGERFGYDNMTCFHSSYMGITHCEKSIMHTDIYATNDKSWNFVFPLVTVEGTEPELDVLAEDMNAVVGVHYLKDVAYAMGDFGYHQTVPMAYYDPEQEKKAPQEAPIRVVYGTYCAQIDETNVAMIRQVYDGDDPAPFADQFAEVPMREVHWTAGAEEASMAKPGGRGY
ncbi:hypothetical protein ACHAXT_009706 [Thalassiosira profunda]